MDVIESLKQKSEENQDPTEESSEEQMAGLEENADLGSGDSETGKKTENADTRVESQNPPPDCEPKRISKRRKVDTAQLAADENDSPASTLQLQSSDDDLE
ncbi:hypothetical protein CRYUN_Cryun13aG0060100 [Craigia yunnanensis]